MVARKSLRRASLRVWGDLGYTVMTTPEAIASAVDRLSRIAHSLQFAQGLNPAQWEALRYLARANKYSTTPGILAEYLGTTKGTVSQTLIALESKGFVERIRCKADRRKIRLGLTDAGQAMLESDPIRRIETATSELPASEQQNLHTAITAIVEELCARKEGPEFGVCGACCHLDRVAGPKACAGSGRCGLTDESLLPEELTQICVNYETAKN